MRSLYTPDADFYALVIPMLVQGVAMSTFFIAMITLVLNGVPAHQVPAASGLSNFARITAGGFAASLTTTLWDRIEAVHQTRLAEVMGAHDPAFTLTLQKLQGAGMTAQQALGAVTNQAVNQAYLLASLDIFRISAWLMVVLVPVVWLTRKAMANGGTHAAAD
jgi:DHA2 family multidrug resistance protein